MALVVVILGCLVGARQGVWRCGGRGRRPLVGCGHRACWCLYVRSANGFAHWDTRLWAMSDITMSDVAKLANLARISMTDEECENLTRELDGILAAVDKLKEVAADDVPATSHPIEMVNVTRPDEPRESFSADEALAGAPAREGDRFLVPRILDED